MAVAEHVLGRDVAREDRVLSPAGDDIGLFTQGFGRNTRHREFDRRDQQVDLGMAQVFASGLGHLDEAEAQMRRARCEIFEQRCHHRGQDIIGNHQAKQAIGRRRVELRRRRDDAFGLAQALPDLGKQHFGKGSRIHPSSLHQQQRVAEIVAQPRQRGAGGRLAEPQSLARQRGIVRFHQSLERDEKVEIETLEPHVASSPALQTTNRTNRLREKQSI